MHIDLTSHVSNRNTECTGRLIQMTEDEKKNNDVDRRVDKLETKFEMFMKSQDERFNSFMQKQTELRQDMKEMQKNFDAKIDKLDAKIDGMGKHFQNVTIAAMVGVGTAVIAVVVMVGTMVYTILTH